MPYEYVLETHPVWRIFDEMGYPPEIINLIFSYNTYYTPFKFAGKELSLCLQYYQINSVECPYFIKNTYHLFIIKMFRNGNDSGRMSCTKKRFIYNFISKFKLSYKKTNLEIYNKFIEYHKCVFENIEPTDYNIIFELKLKKYIYQIKDNDNDNSEGSREFREFRDLIGGLLKKLIYREFLIFINNRVETQNRKLNCKYNRLFDLNFYNYDYNKHKYKLNYLWKNIEFLLMHQNNGKTLSCNTYGGCWSRAGGNDNDNLKKSDLLMFNFMMGYPFKKSWNKKKLAHNLIINEPVDNSYIIYQFENNPEKYNMEMLNIILFKKPFSSIDIKESVKDTMDILKTMELFYYYL